MSAKIRSLIQESVERVKLENEIAIASTVQQTLIPQPLHRDNRRVIRGHYQSASQCGGDWWGYFEANGKLCVAIADATGHGFPSALLTASARSCFSMLEQLAQGDPNFSFSPAAMLQCADRVIFDASHGKVMMTCFVAVLDLDAGTLRYASAGHNPPWLFRHKGEGKPEIQSLMASGRRLGDLEAGDPNFEEKIVEAGPGDLLFLYTDGLLEGLDANGAMYGKKRARQLAGDAARGGAEEVIQKVLADFQGFAGKAPLADDLTLVGVSLL
jgi:sigma-B regulation protein RsbU (phosphoserine phosphatase)